MEMLMTGSYFELLNWLIERDKKVFVDLGIKNVTLSNLDSRMSEKEYEPFKGSFQDAENLTFKDNII